MLSVICPIYNEERYISSFLDSLLEQDYPKDDWEVILIDGMSSDHTRDIILQYVSQFPFFRLIDNPQRTCPYALNRGVDVSKGDVILRMDAHAKYQSNYCSALVDGLKRLKADNVGVACCTEVLHKTSKTLAICEVLSHRLGVGNSSFRIGIDVEQEVDTVPFGCWNADVFSKYGRFDVRLVRNQDIEFNKRIKRNGGHIYILPDTYCTYYARESYTQLSKNMYSNGKWNILTVFFTRDFSSLSLRHFIPLLFILSITVPLLLSIICSYFGVISVISFILYFLVIFTTSVRLAFGKGLNLWFLLITFFVVHFSYGWGSLIGVVSLPLKKTA